jgi:hypothetical protein
VANPILRAFENAFINPPSASHRDAALR